MHNPSSAQLLTLLLLAIHMLTFRKLRQRVQKLAKWQIGFKFASSMTCRVSLTNCKTELYWKKKTKMRWPCAEFVEQVTVPRMGVEGEMKTTWTGANPPNTISPPSLPPPHPPSPLLNRFMDSCHKICTVLDLKQAWVFFPLLAEWMKVWRRRQGKKSFLQSLWCCELAEGEHYGTCWQNRMFFFRVFSDWLIIMLTVEQGLKHN